MAQLSLMGSAASFGCFLAWGKAPGSVISLVVLPGRAGLLVVPGLGQVYGFGDCQQILGMCLGMVVAAN